MARMRWMMGLAPAVVALVVGCGGSSAQPNTPTGTADVAPAGSVATDDQDDSTADLAEHHRHHHHGGFAMFIAMSLDSLGTTPEQDDAIKKIGAELRTKMMPAHDAEKALLMVLADGVAAGSVDQAKVDAAIAQLTSASAGVHDAVADSLNQLHGVLTPPQRVALVDKVEAHLHVWRRENSDDEPTEKDAHGGHLAKLAKDLGLSSDQVEKIRASFKASIGGAKVRFDSAGAEAHLKAFGAAFEADSFDAKTVTAGGPVNANIASWGATRMATLYEAATPVLTADQRTKLADQLRHHANYKRTATET